MFYYYQKIIFQCSLFWPGADNSPNLLAGQVHNTDEAGQQQLLLMKETLEGEKSMNLSPTEAPMNLPVETKQSDISGDYLPPFCIPREKKTQL